MLYPSRFPPDDSLGQRPSVDTANVPSATAFTLEQKTLAPRTSHSGGNEARLRAVVRGCDRRPDEFYGVADVVWLPVARYQPRRRELAIRLGLAAMSTTVGDHHRRPPPHVVFARRQAECAHSCATNVSARRHPLWPPGSRRSSLQHLVRYGTQVDETPCAMRSACLSARTPLFSSMPGGIRTPAWRPGGILSRPRRWTP